MFASRDSDRKLKKMKKKNEIIKEKENRGPSNLKHKSVGVWTFITLEMAKT